MSRKKNMWQLYVYIIGLAVIIMIGVNTVYWYSVFLKENGMAISMLTFAIGFVVWIADKTKHSRLW
jgi:hypothetical protein